MPKPSTDSELVSTPDPAPAVAQEPAADIALDDWCQGKSLALGRRIEALSAFYRRCQRNGVGRADPAWFESEYQAFLRLPA